MPNLSMYPVESLREKLESQLQLLTESRAKLTIHLELLNVDLTRDLNSSYLTKQARIKHLEKAESNIMSHISFLEDLIKKIGGSYNVNAY